MTHTAGLRFQGSLSLTAPTRHVPGKAATRWGTERERGRAAAGQRAGRAGAAGPFSPPPPSPRSLRSVSATGVQHQPHQQPSFGAGCGATLRPIGHPWVLGAQSQGSVWRWLCLPRGGLAQGEPTLAAGRTAGPSPQIKLSRGSPFPWPPGHELMGDTQVSAAPPSAVLLPGQPLLLQGLRAPSLMSSLCAPHTVHPSLRTDRQTGGDTAQTPAPRASTSQTPLLWPGRTRSVISTLCATAQDAFPGGDLARVPVHHEVWAPRKASLLASLRC